MDRAKFAAYDAGRNFSNKAVRSLCYAPHTNLYFDRFGRVQACCSNWSHPAGNITETSLDDLWHGARQKAVRAALHDYEFTAGCDFCKFQVAEGWFGGARMRNFDHMDVTAADPQWPQQMELSISNACNLECIMCDGDHSSAIRTHREKRPAMARIYTDEILESFRKYLPHLRQMKFLGGEPFLVTEHYKIWDMMIEDGVKTRSHVTTNGTQYNSRIERLLAHLPFGFAISLDGVTKQTIERVRINTNYEELMRNTKLFRDYAHERKTSFSLTYCLMLPNWQEFGDYCLMADSWNCPVGVNTVRFPQNLSLFVLPAEELRKILLVMEKQAVQLESQLTLNKTVWFDEYERLRRKCLAGLANTTSPPPRPAPKPTPRNAFVLTVTSDAEIDRANTLLYFLKKFSKADIIVLQARTQRRLQHDHVIDIDLPPNLDDAAAALYLKTSLYRHVQGQAENFCYISNDAVAIHAGIDEIFEHQSSTITFATEDASLDATSNLTLNCRCREPGCHHLREAISCTFGIEIPDYHWHPRNSRAFVFTAASESFMKTWHDATQRIAHDHYWKKPDQGALTATLWQAGLAQKAPAAASCIQF